MLNYEVCIFLAYMLNLKNSHVYLKVYLFNVLFFFNI